MKPKYSKRWPKRSVETFFDTWNPNMAYILGFFASDGTMYKNKRGSCYIAFCSTDKELIILLKKIMRVSNKIEIYKAKKENWKLRYTLQIGSKKIYDGFLKLGFTPNKSLTLVFPDIPNNVLAHFIRGYFDGDGCAYYGCIKRKNRTGYAKHLQINLRCGSKKFLESVQKKLMQLIFIKPGSLYWHSGAFSLAYSGKDVVKLYGFLYPNTKVPNLERKRIILEKGIEALGP